VDSDGFINALPKSVTGFQMLRGEPAAHTGALKIRIDSVGKILILR
jgi:hypothetical protein